MFIAQVLHVVVDTDLFSQCYNIPITSVQWSMLAGDRERETDLVVVGYTVAFDLGLRDDH